MAPPPLSLLGAAAYSKGERNVARELGRLLTVAWQTAVRLRRRDLPDVCSHLLRQRQVAAGQHDVRTLRSQLCCSLPAVADERRVSGSAQQLSAMC